MSIAGFLFFAFFVLVVVGCYLAIRRGFAPPKLTAIAGIIGGVVAMSLFSLAQGNIPTHAVLVGLLVGGGISTVMNLMALYFHAQETTATQ